MSRTTACATNKRERVALVSAVASSCWPFWNDTILVLASRVKPSGGAGASLVAICKQHRNDHEADARKATKANEAALTFIR